LPTLDELTARIAVHESAHSLMSVLTVGVPGSVEMKGGGGVCTLPDFEPLLEHWRQHLIYLGLGFAAGIEGERLVHGWNHPDTAQGDLRNLALIGDELKSCEPEWAHDSSERIAKRLRATARYLLERHRTALDYMASRAATKTVWPSFEITSFLEDRCPEFSHDEPLLLRPDWQKRWWLTWQRAWAAAEQRAAEAQAALLGTGGPDDERARLHGTDDMRLCPMRAGARWGH
jgi:hypothetical protein